MQPGVMQPPTAGRIVWYYSLEDCLRHRRSQQRFVPTAAIVNQHADRHGRCSLTVFEPTGPRVVTAPECDVYEPQWGFWSWMPYQMAKAHTAEGNESESAVDPEGEEDPDDNAVETETGQRPEEEEEAEIPVGEGPGSGDEGSAPPGASGTVEG